MSTENSNTPTATAGAPDCARSSLATGSASERETRQWWAVHDESVMRVTGYSCAPANPDMWWCPQIGYSCAERHHLFATEAEAIDKLLSELERRLEETQERITAYRLRRQNATAKPTPAEGEAR